MSTPNGPSATPPRVAGDARALSTLLQGRRVAVLTGAGCSTESGIPDYRGEGTRRRATNPIQYRQFLRDPAARQRYWARSYLGWPRVAAALPNPAHRALADLESRGLLSGLVTQNVDRLHHAAGSRHVVELHGALHDVRCLDCDTVVSRDTVQARLRDAHPDFATGPVEFNPDGDAVLDEAAVARFTAPACVACGGPLKPDVVFFGESVPRQRVADAQAIVAEADVLLVVGSSLTVFSGYRFVRAAAKRGQPVAIVNLGETRGDPLATLRVDAQAGALLPELAARMTAAA